MSVNDDGDDPAGDFVASMVDGMVTGYIMFVTFLNPDGTLSYWGDCMEGQSPFTTLGMAHTVATLEAATIITNDQNDDWP